MAENTFAPFSILEGPVGSGKTQRLVTHTVGLLKDHPSDSVLVLCSNYYRKSQFVEYMQTILEGCYTQFQVTTYYALVRNALSLYWPLVETMIGSKGKVGGEAVIFPELSGFEASEYVLKRVLTETHAPCKELLEAFTGLEKSLMMQLLRRIRLRSENQLTRQEMLNRSQLTGEAYTHEVDTILKAYDRWCFQLRVLDNSKQMDVFHGLLNTHEEVAQFFTQRIRHVVVDDADEMTPAQQHFLAWLLPHVDSVVLAVDPEGGTRRGYLNAYPEAWKHLTNDAEKWQRISLTREDPWHQAATQLRANWTSSNPKTLPIGEHMGWRSQALTRLEMLDDVMADLVEAITQHKENPGNMVLVMPKVDTLSKLYFQQQCRKHGIPLQILTGTHRPVDNPICQSLLLLLQLANAVVWQWPLSPIELYGLLRQCFQLHHDDPTGLETLIQQYRESLPKAGVACLPSSDCLNEHARLKYEALLQWLDDVKDLPFEDQLYSAFKDVLSPALTQQDELTDLHQLIRSLYIKDVATVFFADASDAERLAAKEWLLQVKTGVVSDNPNKPNTLDDGAVVLGTPQKVIDLQIKRGKQYWLDVSSREWSRTDHAPLYNAWVHSPQWDGTTTDMTEAHMHQLARQRAAHITRTLLLYATEHVYLYSSQSDEKGNQHTGIFHQMLQLPSQTSTEGIEAITLRPDQAPVLQYQTGPMAITAVPGAGKTFINVALLLDLIKRGIPPEKLLVLTYMDSAARTILNRLRTKLIGVANTLPTVSTIHSLALRIITEDDHGRYLGLDTQYLNIMSDVEQREIIQQLKATVGEQDAFSLSPESVIRGIQLAKSYEIRPDDLATFCQSNRQGFRQLRELIPFYRAYEAYRQEHNKLDFTDLIVGAITLLEKYPEVRKKYNRQFAYVIEDEAQDSSLLLQRLLKLLTASHGNLIRTGDTNQSITTTFSTAETSVFREFIAQCQERGLVVHMEQSSRCATQVIELANAFVSTTLNDARWYPAFQKNPMQPVEGQNPPLLEPLQAKTFETLDAEYTFIGESIERLQQSHPESSIAVLLRRRDDVLNITQFLQDRGIKAISHVDNLKMNPLFLFILNTLQLLENPANKDFQHSFLEGLMGFQCLEAPLSEGHPLHEKTLLALEPSELQAHSDANTASLLQLYYDMQDIMRYAFGRDMCRLLVRISDLFLKEPQQRSFGYLCALQAHEWVDTMPINDIETLTIAPLNYVIEQFKHCLEKNQLPFKYMMEADALPSHLKSQFVHVMTTHKSKGQEFDAVFLPSLTMAHYPSDVNHIRIGEGDKIELQLNTVRAQLGETESNDADLARQKRQNMVEEEARLVFVGVTRAKRALFVSTSYQVRQWGRKKPTEPSDYFHILAQHIHPTPAPTTPMEVVDYAQ